VLAGAALAAADARAAGGSWSGTVTLESTRDHVETHQAAGEGPCGSSSSREAARSRYRATARLTAGAQAAEAEVDFTSETETTMSCSGRITCGGATLLDPGSEHAYSESRRQKLAGSLTGRGPATVAVELDEAGGSYSVRAEFPALSGGTQRFDVSERVTGACSPVPPNEVHTIDSHWTVEARAGEGSGRLGPGGSDHLVGSARIDEGTTFRWDLRRAPPDCDGLARAAARERKRAERARSAAESLRAAADGARLAAMAALGGRSAAGDDAAGTAAAAFAALGHAGAALGGGGGSASWQRLVAFVDDGSLAGTQAALQAAQTTGPTGPVGQLLVLLDELQRQVLEARDAESMARALEEAARSCPGARRP